MTEFPKIKGIEWVEGQVSPSIIKVPIKLVDKKASDMELKNIPEFDHYQYIDLTKVSVLRHFFSDGDDSETPSDHECIIWISGMENGIVVDIGLQPVLEAWLFHKTWFLT